MEAACDRLGLDVSGFQAYVYASPELQAECFAWGSRECILRISSSMIDLLDLEELRFVLGHEIGHFLFGHGADREMGCDRSLEGIIAQRAREISADRVGLLASSSLETAVRAIMKTAVGLGNEILRFDVGSFLAQLRHVENHGFGESSSHPSLLLRSRAVLWFSLSREYQRLTASTATGPTLQRIDQQIADDLHRYVDGPARRAIEGSRREVLLWLMAAAAVENGRLRRKDQQLMEEQLGFEVVRKMANFLRTQTPTEAHQHTLSRLDEALAAYRIAAPRESSWRIAEMVTRVAREMDCESLLARGYERGRNR